MASFTDVIAALNQVLTSVSTLATTMGNALQQRGFKTGGTAGQVPVKASGTDYDWAWQDPEGGGAELPAWMEDIESISIVDEQLVIVLPGGATFTINANKQ